MSDDGAGMRISESVRSREPRILKTVPTHDSFACVAQIHPASFAVLSGIGEIVRDAKALAEALAKIEAGCHGFFSSNCPRFRPCVAFDSACLSVAYMRSVGVRWISRAGHPSDCVTFSHALRCAG